jgi:Ni,Fe-hydrogenase I cytochrome b subunit
MLDNVKNGKSGKDGGDIWDTHVWHTLFEWNFQLEIIGNIYENEELLK